MALLIHRLITSLVRMPFCWFFSAVGGGGGGGLQAVPCHAPVSSSSLPYASSWSLPPLRLQGAFPILQCKGTQQYLFTYHAYNVSIYYHDYCLPLLIAASQLTRDIEPMLGWCWASVVDGGPTSAQHWLNVSCLLGLALQYLIQTLSARRPTLDVNIKSPRTIKIINIRSAFWSAYNGKSLW